LIRTAELTVEGEPNFGERGRESESLGDKAEYMNYLLHRTDKS
jgi:hypothetical protein